MSAMKAKLISTMSSKKPLYEWVICIVVIGLILVFVAGNHIVAALLNDESGLCVIIFGIFVASIIKSLFDVIYIDEQIKLASEQVKNLFDVRGIRIFVTHSKTSVFRSHVENMYRIYKHDTDIRQDNLIELVSDNLYAKVRFVDTASGILVTLGLVGTIVGLIGAVSGISSVVESVGGDTAKLLSGMNETMSAMGTAFFTTLLGSIFGGVLLRILNGIVSSNINHLINQVSELTEVYILPKLRKSAKERDYEDERDKQVETVQGNRSKK